MNLDRRDELWSVQNVEKKWEKDICFAARMERLVLLMKYPEYFKMRKKQMVFWKWEKSDILQRNMWKNIVDTFFKEEYNMSEWNRKIKSKTLRKEDACAIWLYYREL